MIDGRPTGCAWNVFRAGHHGWFFTDGKGVARGPYGSRDQAVREQSMMPQPPAVVRMCDHCLQDPERCDYPACLTKT